MRDFRSWAELQHFWTDLAPHLGAVVLCPGSRNAPLVLAMPDGTFEVHRCLDEREAGYFALGRSEELGRPVAVITTSGTAVANLYPSLLEARERQISLWLISADRLAQDRFPSAPQSMDQQDLFSDRIPYFENEAPWGMDIGPIHCNCRLPELGALGPRNFGESSKAPTPVAPMLKASVDSPTQVFSEFVQSWLDRQAEGVVIVGPLPQTHRAETLEFLRRLGWPVWCESLSGLRGVKEISPLELKSGERHLKKFMDRRSPRLSVLRLGGVPTTRLWRDLGSDSLIPSSQILSIDPWGRAGLHRGRVDVWAAGLLSRLKVPTLASPKPEVIELMADDRVLETKKKALLVRYPRSEPALLWALEKCIPSGESIFLGNSMPIREWDLVSEGRQRKIVGSRGLNGIDGLISQALGHTSNDQTLWAILGDQTGIYGMGGLLWTQNPVVGSHRIVIVNNSGGRIFDRLPSLVSSTSPEERAANFVQEDHQVQWSHVAQSFGMEFQSWQRVPDLPVEGHSVLIEVLPDETETENFWNEWSRLFL